MANKRLLIEAAERFIYKCEINVARSKESYKMFKEALDASEVDNTSNRLKCFDCYTEWKISDMVGTQRCPRCNGRYIKYQT